MKRVMAAVVAAVLLLCLLLGAAMGCKKSTLPEGEKQKPPKGTKGVGTKMPTEAEKAAKQEAARAKGIVPEMDKQKAAGKAAMKKKAQ